MYVLFIKKSKLEISFYSIPSALTETCLMPHYRSNALDSAITVAPFLSSQGKCRRKKKETHYFLKRERPQLLT
jgi:hypothetical protein